MEKTEAVEAAEELVEEKKASPFICRPGDKVIYEKNKMSGKVGQYFVKQRDVMAVDALRQYTYLNAHMIGLILYRNLNFPTKAVKELLAKLTKNNLVSRLRIQYTDAFGKEHMSSYIYQVQDKTLKPMQKNAAPDSNTIYSYLAYNQFHIAISQTYQTRNFVYSKGIGPVDGTLAITSQTKNATFSIVTARSNDEDLWTRLKEVNASEGKNIIILCENELHALNIEYIRSSMEGAEEKSVFYLTDFATTNEFPLQNLIHVLPGCKEYEIVSIPVDGRKNV